MTERSEVQQRACQQQRMLDRTDWNQEVFTSASSSFVSAIGAQKQHKINTTARANRSYVIDRLAGFKMGPSVLAANARRGVVNIIHPLSPTAFPFPTHKFALQNTLTVCSHFSTRLGHSVVMGSDVGRIPNA